MPFFFLMLHFSTLKMNLVTEIKGEGFSRFQELEKKEFC